MGAGEVVGTGRRCAALRVRAPVVPPLLCWPPWQARLGLRSSADRGMSEQSEAARGPEPGGDGVGGRGRGGSRVKAPAEAGGDAPRWRYAVAGMVAAAVALGATELVAGLLPGAPSLVQSVASVVIDLAPTGVVRAAIATLGTQDKPALVTGVVVLSLLFGALLALAARRRRWVAVLGLVAFGLLGAWAGARPPGTALWRPAVAALAGVLAGVAALAALAWRSAGRAPELT